MIKFENISKVYPNGTVALQDVSFSIDEGDILVVAGPSGAGKTTLLKLILAEERPSQGEVFVSDQALSSLSKEGISELRRDIGSIFQDYKLLPSKTLEENVCFILEAIGATEEEIQKNLPQVLNIVGLEGKEGCFPRELSSGEKQRAAVARALIHKPDILLADEPTGNLDPKNTIEMIKLFQRINELGTTIVFATHSREIIERLETRTLLLKDGSLEADDPRGHILL